MKHRYLLSFATIYLVAWFVLPWEQATTHAGAAIGHAAAALGGTLVVWVPIAGTVAAIKWARRDAD